MAEEYDLVIIGGGTGGYVAAIKAAQIGLKTAVVEKEKLGGTCLHKGCIPSKSLLRSAEVHAMIKESDDYGISVKGIDLQFDQVQKRKDTIVNKLYNGVSQLMKKGKIDVYEGHARILGPSIFSPTPGTVSVEMKDGSDNVMLIPKNVIIATGSSPRFLPGVEIDGEKVLTSDEALQLKELPASIIIVGGGVIGIEWASMLSDFEVKVTVIEQSDRILPEEETDISKEVARRLSQRGVEVITNAKLSPEKTIKGKNVSVTAEVDGKDITFTAEKLLMSVGRKANIEDIGLENTDIYTENGFIKTNEFYQTKESHIYAIGDVIGGMQLAHVASREGLIAIEHLTDKKPRALDYMMVPRCTYSRPEVASIGFTEEQAKTHGYEVKAGTFSFQAIGKALINGDAEGFVKFVANKENDDLLGVHMIGSHVTDLISEAALAKLVDASNFEISETIHPHPALSEILGEGALAVEGKAIHS